MAYSGKRSHTKTWEARRKKSSDDLAGVRETVDLARKAGLPVNFVSGGSTGTYNIDKENGLTELEAGSYVFMDTNYFGIGGKQDDALYTDFEGALTVLTTVDSKRHPNQVTTDYGNKALNRPTDQVKGMPWLKVGSQGAEYGIAELDRRRPRPQTRRARGDLLHDARHEHRCLRPLLRRSRRPVRRRMADHGPRRRGAAVTRAEQAARDVLPDGCRRVRTGAILYGACRN